MDWQRKYLDFFSPVACVILVPISSMNFVAIGANGPKVSTVCYEVIPLTEFQNIPALKILAFYIHYDTSRDQFTIRSLKARITKHFRTYAMKQYPK